MPNVTNRGEETPTQRAERRLGERIEDEARAAVDRGMGLPDELVTYPEPDPTADMARDNWPTGGEQFICATCLWFLAKKGEATGTGRCKRRAPALGGFPVVFPSDRGCGDHKLSRVATPAMLRALEVDAS